MVAQIKISGSPSGTALYAVVNDMKQLINEPTRITEYSKTLIDLIFTNREHKMLVRPNVSRLRRPGAVRAQPCMP